MHLEVVSRGRDDRSGNPPLLFVHGAWHAAWCWDMGFLDRIAAAGFETHALSLRGHGASDAQSSLRSIRIRDYVDDVCRVIASLRAPPVLIGHSLGGFIAQKASQQLSLPGMVLMASMPPAGALPTLGRLLRQDPVGVLQSHLRLALHPLVSSPRQVRRLFFSEAMPDAAVDAIALKLGDEAFMAYLDAAFLETFEARPGTAVLVLGAGEDAIFPDEVTQAIARGYRTEPIVFPGMGHDMMLDVGWEKVADVIVDWLRRGGAGKSRIAA